VAEAQVWTLIALLFAAQVAIVLEIRRTNDRLSDRMTDGFAALRSEMGQLRTELRAEIAVCRADLKADIGQLRGDLHRHIDLGHRPSA
jgi:hypothetical protein